MAGFQLAGPAAEVSKILYGESRKSYQSPNAEYDNSGAIPRNAVIRQDFEELGAFDLFYICRHICSRTCQLESSHLGTKIAITFTIFTFRP